MLPLLNLNFKDAVVKSGARSEYINATIILQDNILMAKTSTKVLAIKYDLSKCRKVYSLPSNDKHTAWTEKSINKEPNELVLMYWSAFKPNMKVKGKVENNVFIIKTK
jgi:hypothetical protein